uniref:Retinol dehydrogenase 13-like n=1 Tax=Tetraselmis sp. GSL018 TaxID=582737 RepID=A0A061R0Z7_9CHLO|mmetsp:Transcript_13111/g.31078  ORF Transcript_13111/g.31078 Transcript_13111/m.31078 type:complete len:303 (+) Transcript_13111:211-1119(+)
MDKSQGKLENEACIVTGGNSGIGKEVAYGLMSQGAHVFLACRDLEKCGQAKADLDSRGSRGSCECRKLDLCCFSSVREFAHNMRKEKRVKRGLKVLVNNAGVMGHAPSDDPLVDGHLLPNHLGPFLLTSELLPIMKPGSRIVNVSSRAHFQGSLQIQPDASGRPVITGRPLTWYHSYARSKLCNVLHAAELQRRLDDEGRAVGVHSVSPGLVSTGIFRNLWAPLRWAASPLVRAVYQTPEQGARTVLHAASAPELEGRRALYLHNMSEQPPSALAQDPTLAKQLWLASEHIVCSVARSRSGS